jgi:hypothetical protein
MFDISEASAGEVCNKESSGCLSAGATCAQATQSWCQSIRATTVRDNVDELQYENALVGAVGTII